MLRLVSAIASLALGAQGLTPLALACCAAPAAHACCLKTQAPQEPQIGRAPCCKATSAPAAGHKEQAAGAESLRRGTPVVVVLQSDRPIHLSSIAPGVLRALKPPLLRRI